MAKYKFVKGSDVEITVNMIDKKTKAPYNLLGFTGATATFPNSDGTTLNVPGTLLSEDLGRIKFSLTDSQTDLLQEGTDQSIQMTVDQGTKRTISILDAALDIFPKLF